MVMTDVSTRSSATELRESMVAVTRQMRRHRPDHGLTLSQMEVLSEVERTGIITPAELAVRLLIRRGHNVPDEVRAALADQLASHPLMTVHAAHQLAYRLSATAASRTLAVADLGVSPPEGGALPLGQGLTAVG